ncbi:MAG TPA: hypothetical protein VJL39_00320 [Candidatus Paceibacterota bacterium]
MNIDRDDAALVEAFFRSLEWATAREEEAFKKKRGLKNVIRRYLRKEFRVPDSDPTPLEIELATGRVEFAIRSNWARKAARTRKRKKELRKRLLIKKAERAFGKYRAARWLERAPPLFSNLPLQQKQSRGQSS